MKYFDIYNKAIIDSKANTVYQFKADNKTFQRIMKDSKSSPSDISQKILRAVTDFARYKGIIDDNESISIY
ncbi:hypothetical protein [Photobacterium sp. GB-72]|uniref:hypothetical protein n=1 Tax=Photobacterium sp. GB-72 TaxID=2022105 RepID=UPI000D16E1FE|nr:hypothetical protein [Photobacterium sp. GB-72]PSV28095.1 hypothetical protein C9J40_19640 [Photobacterium sp. GB-72]